MIDFNRDLAELAEKKNGRVVQGQGWMRVSTRLGLTQTFAISHSCSDRSVARN